MTTFRRVQCHAKTAESTPNFPFYVGKRETFHDIYVPRTIDRNIADFVSCNTSQRVSCINMNRL